MQCSLSTKHCSYSELGLSKVVTRVWFFQCHVTSRIDCGLFVISALLFQHLQVSQCREWLRCSLVRHISSLYDQLWMVYHHQSVIRSLSPPVSILGWRSCCQQNAYMLQHMSNVVQLLAAFFTVHFLYSFLLVQCRWWNWTLDIISRIACTR